MRNLIRVSSGRATRGGLALLLEGRSPTTSLRRTSAGGIKYSTVPKMHSTIDGSHMVVAEKNGDLAQARFHGKTLFVSITTATAGQKRIHAQLRDGPSSSWQQQPDEARGRRSSGGKESLKLLFGSKNSSG